MRRITSTLTIGNGTDAIQHGADFDRVVSLAAANEHTTHNHSITDGEHEYSVFTEAVDAICDGLQNESQVLVHCQAGLSRSVAAAIAALVVAEGWDYDEAYDACQGGFIHPAPELLDSARTYIDTHS